MPSQPNRALLGEKPLRLCFCMQRDKHETSIGPNMHSQLFETSHATTINTKHNEHDKLKKSRTQSTQAIFCTTISTELFLESNTNHLFGTTHKDNTHQRPES